MTIAPDVADGKLLRSPRIRPAIVPS